MKTDFKELDARLLSRSHELLRGWFPNGRVVERNFLIGALDGRAGSSLIVDLESGAWRDFSSEENGHGLLSLRAACRKVTKATVALELAALVGTPIAEEKGSVPRGND